MTMFTDVQDFHEHGQLPCPETPNLYNVRELVFRMKLIREEFQETIDCSENIVFSNNTQEYWAKLFGELTDMMYVILGTFVTFGIDPEPFWDAIHAANMDKFRNGLRLREDGKVLKPDDWKPADLDAVLGRQLETDGRI